YNSIFHLCFLKLLLLTGPSFGAPRQPVFVDVDINSRLFCRPHTHALSLFRATFDALTSSRCNLLLPALGLNLLAPSTQR
ncbi:hypothetical protein R3P38DRAFT_3125981, partial [Favolaschia claudopus]